MQAAVEATLFGGYFIRKSEGLDTSFTCIDAPETLAEPTAVQAGQFRLKINSGKVDRGNVV